ncbi:sugar nucleotide-binding protein [Candidatus Micrarchaeota archaeon]|nr:sugar nucleotide-binding protein [Candidatus Micrarchaeota archaeon]
MLITGASGVLGQEVAKRFPDALKPPHSELDVTNRAEVEACIEKNRPDVVIHLAAAVSPVKCHTNKEWAWKTNVLGTQHLVDALLKHHPNTFLALMSTPCIFDGEDENPKDEFAFPFPDNFYGLSKAMQELIVSRSGLNHVIIRSNFVAFTRWRYPKAFTDRRSNYLFAPTVADGIADVLKEGITGVVHVLGDRIISMYELARLCPDSEDVKPMTLDEYYSKNAGGCRLTKNMILASTRWKRYAITSAMTQT